MAYSFIISANCCHAVAGRATVVIRVSQKCRCQTLISTTTKRFTVFKRPSVLCYLCPLYLLSNLTKINAFNKNDKKKDLLDHKRYPLMHNNYLNLVRVSCQTWNPNHPFSPQDNIKRCLLYRLKRYYHLKLLSMMQKQVFLKLLRVLCDSLQQRTALGGSACRVGVAQSLILVGFFYLHSWVKQGQEKDCLNKTCIKHPRRIGRLTGNIFFKISFRQICQGWLEIEITFSLGFKSRKVLMGGKQSPRLVRVSWLYIHEMSVKPCLSET